MKVETPSVADNFQKPEETKKGSSLKSSEGAAATWRSHS